MSTPGIELRQRFVAYAASRDVALREELIRELLPLARAVARRYAGRGEPFDDLVQIATVGLIKAVDRFDPERGVKFESYAIPTIVGEIKRHFRDRSWALHVPRRLKELQIQLSSLVESLTASLGRSPTIPELAAAASVEVEDVIDALESADAYSALSLSAPVGDDPEMELVDTLSSGEAEYELADDRALILEGMRHLDARERRIVYLRFFEGLTQSQIAARVGISQMHVSRLIRHALGAMRSELAGEEEDGDDGDRAD